MLPEKSIKYSRKKEKRQLKIYPKHISRSGADVVVSEIRLCGKWLEDLGFTYGKYVELGCEENKIIITVSNGKLL